jgi:lysophospholipase L1-like esterase
MGFATVQEKETKIFIAGDSTAQTYREERDGLIKGWGQMLDYYLKDNIEVVNHAIGGRSTNSFIAEGRWEKLISEVRPGDYVFIQFGHNDASTRPERHSSYEEYEANLKRMISDVRGKNACPVLLTSVVMRTFVNGHLTDDRLKGYPVITRKVAKEEDVPLIDINQMSRDFITMLGDEASKPYYRWVEPGVDPKKPEGLQDDTHMMEKGAMQIARFIAEGIAELNLPELSENIIITK